MKALTKELTSPCPYCNLGLRRYYSVAREDIIHVVKRKKHGAQYVQCQDVDEEFEKVRPKPASKGYP